MLTVMSPKVREFIESKKPEVITLEPEVHRRLAELLKIEYSQREDGLGFFKQYLGHEYDSHSSRHGGSAVVWLPLKVEWEINISGNQLIFDPILTESDESNQSDSDMFLLLRLFQALMQFMPEVSRQTFDFPYDIVLFSTHSTVYVFAKDEEEEYTNMIMSQVKVKTVKLEL